MRADGDGAESGCGDGEYKETLEKFAERHARLMNGIIPDLMIDLYSTELKSPTPRLETLLEGQRHLIDVQPLLPGERYWKDGGATSSAVNRRQQQVTRVLAEGQGVRRGGAGR